MVSAAEQHGLASLLCQRLAIVASDLISDELESAARTYLAMLRRSANAAVRELAKVVDILNRAGVRSLPFKGPVPAAQAYPDFALRPCRDLDVLIRREDITATRAALRSLGYVGKATDLSSKRQQYYDAFAGQATLYASDRLALEPHWAMWPRILGVAFEASDIWPRAQVVQCGAYSLPCPSPEDALLIACIHGCKETWTRAVWISDIAGLIIAHPQLDWDAILARAKGAQRMTLLGAELAARLFDAPLPAMVRQRIADDPSVGRLSRAAESALFMPTSDTRFVLRRTQFRFRMHERWTDRLRYAGRILTLPQKGEFGAVDLPEQMAFLYPMIRMGRLCHMHGVRPLWRAVRSRFA